jgi:hypothetical protein
VPPAQPGIAGRGPDPFGDLWDRHGDGDALLGEPRLPEEPTAEAPGTEAKIRVLQRRASRRELLHHSADLVLDTERASSVARVLLRDDASAGVNARTARS